MTSLNIGKFTKAGIFNPLKQGLDTAAAQIRAQKKSLEELEAKHAVLLEDHDEFNKRFAAAVAILKEIGTCRESDPLSMFESLSEVLKPFPTAEYGYGSGAYTFTKGLDDGLNRGNTLKEVRRTFNLLEGLGMAPVHTSNDVESKLSVPSPVVHALFDRFSQIKTNKALTDAVDEFAAERTVENTKIWEARLKASVAELQAAKNSNKEAAAR